MSKFWPIRWIPNSPQMVQDLAKFGGSQLSTKCPRFGQIWWIPTCDQSSDGSVQNRILARPVRQRSKIWPNLVDPNCRPNVQDLAKFGGSQLVTNRVTDLSRIGFWPGRSAKCPSFGRFVGSQTPHKWSKIWPNLVDPNCRPNVQDLAKIGGSQLVTNRVTDLSRIGFWPGRSAKT